MADHRKWPICIVAFIAWLLLDLSPVCAENGKVSAPLRKQPLLVGGELQGLRQVARALIRSAGLGVATSNCGSRS